MILTEIFVVMCTLAGQCVNYADVTPGVLSVDACERAIHELARDHSELGMVLHHERSSCVLMPINTQNDLAS
jgi:hypothetical protein